MSISHLHDDMLLHLTKLVSARDCLSLAMSGTNERFSILYATNRKELSVSECYFLLNKPWRKFFQQYIFPSSITVFNVSHCYWLKAKVICRCITKMDNLEELSIEDTRMSLKKMPLVFEACKRLTKLSLDLKEDNLDEFKKGVMEKSSLKCLKKGFRKLTNLELFVYVVPNGPFSKTWLVPLGVLKWCKHCIGLSINITYEDESDCSSQDSAGHDQDFSDEENCEEDVMEELLPHYTWMKRLKSLKILVSQSQHKDDLAEVFILDWLQKLRPQSLERLWIDSDFDSDAFDEYGLLSEMPGPIVKSTLADFVPFSDFHVAKLNDKKCRYLEHLGNIPFDYVENGLEHLTELKYASGPCYDGSEGLNDFCKYHPNLEQLHVVLENYREEDQHLFDLRGWNLPLLKVLVYSCARLTQSAMDHLVEACPNIEQFHIAFSDSLSRTETVDVFSTIQFQNLKWLAITGDSLFDGSFLLLIVKHCPKLERIHLLGSFEADTFFLHLAKCFPFARNLRDLRIEWPNLQKNLSPLPFFFRALKICKSLERVALVTKAQKRSSIHYTPLQDSILPFVKGAPRLVALCLVGFPIDPFVVHLLLIKEIVPDRPAFWFYLDSELPKASDLTVPRIHYNGIVDPIDPYYAPPRF